ncbi:MAG: hypothetical protein PHF79_02745 [Candidatus Pacebacteria bacterium]|nr:hypothetical protein [Candidatus Paceibacterota bacterium]
MGSNLLSWNERVELGKKIEAFLSKEMKSLKESQRIIGLEFARWLGNITPISTPNLEKCKSLFIDFLKNSDDESANKIRAEIGGK